LLLPLRPEYRDQEYVQQAAVQQNAFSLGAKEGASVEPHDTIEEQFLHELRRRGIPLVAQRSDDRYVINVLGVEYTVNLENIRRRVARDADPAAISAFVDGVLAARVELPPWPDAATGIRYLAAPSDQHSGDTLCESITPAMSRVIAFADESESLVTWLSPAHLARWGVSHGELERHAASNMDRLLAATRLEIQSVSGCHLGIFSTDSVFKASLIFSPTLRSFVSSLGWPLLVVAPCRDFIYAFTDPSLISHFGDVVVREFNESDYPVTREVLQVSDAGVSALGAFGA
jgi:hypothetical protein